MCNTFLENNPGKYILKENNLFRKKYPTPLCGNSDQIKNKCPQMCCGYGKCPYNKKTDKKLCSTPLNIEYSWMHCPKEKQGKPYSPRFPTKNYFRTECPWLCSACDE